MEQYQKKILIYNPRGKKNMGDHVNGGRKFVRRNRQMSNLCSAEEDQ